MEKFMVESAENIAVDRLVVQQLTEAVATMTVMLDKALGSHQEQSKDIEYIREQLLSFRESVRKIAKILHEGNGERPLVSRVAVLEEKLAFYVGRVEEVLEALEKKNRAEQELQIAGKSGRYTIAAALIAGLLGLVVGIVNLLSGS